MAAEVSITEQIATLEKLVDRLVTDRQRLLQVLLDLECALSALHPTNAYKTIVTIEGIVHTALRELSVPQCFELRRTDKGGTDG